jgi:hypothetical protein
MRATAWLSLLRDELAHPQGPVRGLGEPHQDLEVGVRQPGLGLQLSLDAVEEQPVGGQKAAPGPLLLAVEPAGVIHVTLLKK